MLHSSKDKWNGLSKWGQGVLFLEEKLPSNNLRGNQKYAERLWPQNFGVILYEIFQRYLEFENQKQLKIWIRTILKFLIEQQPFISRGSSQIQGVKGLVKWCQIGDDLNSVKLRFYAISSRPIAFLIQSIFLDERLRLLCVFSVTRERPVYILFTQKLYVHPKLRENRSQSWKYRNNLFLFGN